MTRTQLVEDNMKLVYHLVNRYYPTHIADEDIIQTGMMGLCKAADTWDESKSEFSTYACHCILNEIRKEFRSRCKHKEVWSLDYPITDDEGRSTTTGDMTVGAEDVEFVDEEPFYEQLRPKERLIVDYKRMGLSNREVAEKLGCHINNVTHHVRKLRYLWRFTSGN